MPQYRSTLSQSRDVSLPAPSQTFDGVGRPSGSTGQSGERAASQIGGPQLRGSSNIGVDHPIADERAGDISLVSVSVHCLSSI